MPSSKRAADKFRRARIVAERKREVELLGQYRTAWQAIKSKLDNVTAQISAARSEGKIVSRGWLLRAHRLDGLLGQVEGEISLIADFAERSITSAQADAVLAGHLDADELMRLSLGPPPPGAFFQPAFPTEAFRELVGFASDGKPLGDLLATLGPDVAQEMKRTLVSGVALGQNPRKIARSARTALGGNASRALNIARTEVLRSYREATRQTYAANKDVVQRWAWNASLDGRTCPMCWSMHGEEFDSEVLFETHPGCRCSMIPVTKSWAELGFPGVEETKVTLTPGSEVFAGLDPVKQRAILGPGKFAAYRDGRIGLSDLVLKTRSTRWGGGRRVASLDSALANARMRS